MVTSALSVVIPPAKGRIAFVTPRYGESVVGGSEAVVREAAHGLAGRGYDVELLTTCALDHYTWANELAPGMTSDGLRDGTTVPDGPGPRPRPVDVDARAGPCGGPARRGRGARLDQRALSRSRPVPVPLRPRARVRSDRLLALPVLVDAVLHRDRARADDPHAVPARRAVRLPPQRRRPRWRRRQRSGSFPSPSTSSATDWRRWRRITASSVRPSRCPRPTTRPAFASDTTSVGPMCFTPAGVRGARAGRSWWPVSGSRRCDIACRSIS